MRGRRSRGNRPIDKIELKIDRCGDDSYLKNNRAYIVPNRAYRSKKCHSCMNDTFWTVPKSCLIVPTMVLGCDAAQDPADGFNMSTEELVFTDVLMR